MVYYGLYLAIVIFIIIAIGWLIWGNISIQTSRFMVQSNDLPKEFDGFSIAHISDLHNAEFGKDNEKLISILREENMGIIVLQDEVVELEYSGMSIQLIGLNDPDFAEQDSFLAGSVLEKTLSQLDIRNGFTILLSHRPEHFKIYQDKGVKLVLSGHAHGGQFRLPFICGIVAPDQGFFPEYDAGVYTENGTAMVVSRGIGNSIIPVRFNNRPEIVIVELEKD